ncbi:hypothetical protein PVAP13_5KG071200 [Panicum virgatum]|uniref:Uncharacterized protein n=1 Tax=Panicum virgatum TaxID=38727 RepID=A0A8T0SFI7_PANVG|nr:hypothetical protein PVAP13_5KG071200 [Panicum virgatum]
MFHGHGHVTRRQDAEGLVISDGRFGRAGAAIHSAVKPVRQLPRPQTLLSEPFGLRTELQLSSPGRAVIGIAEDLNHFLLGVTNHCSIHFDDCKAALCGRRHGPVRAATMGYKSR